MGIAKDREFIVISLLICCVWGSGLRLGDNDVIDILISLCLVCLVSYTSAGISDQKTPAVANHWMKEPLYTAHLRFGSWSVYRATSALKTVLLQSSSKIIISHSP